MACSSSRPRIVGSSPAAFTPVYIFWMMSFGVFAGTNNAYQPVTS